MRPVRLLLSPAPQVGTFQPGGRICLRTCPLAEQGRMGERPLLFRLISDYCAHPRHPVAGIRTNASVWALRRRLVPKPRQKAPNSGKSVAQHRGDLRARNPTSGAGLRAIGGFWCATFDKLGVTGSSPVPPTLQSPAFAGFSVASTVEARPRKPGVTTSVTPRLRDLDNHRGEISADEHRARTRLVWLVT
jgi:hypothetical protein